MALSHKGPDLPDLAFDLELWHTHDVMLTDHAPMLRFGLVAMDVD